MTEEEELLTEWPFLFNEEEFMEANPGRDRSNDTVCWVCGGSCENGMCVCPLHYKLWNDRDSDTKMRQGANIHLWATHHPDFNGVRVSDPLVLANSPWIAND